MTFIRKTILLIIVLIAAGSLSYAQTIQIDSLKALLAETTVDTTKSRLNSDIFNELRRVDITEAYKYIETSLELAISSDDKVSKARSFHGMGLYYYLTSDYNQALEYNYKSIKLKEELGDVNGMSSSWNNIGILYSVRGEEDKALEAYHRSVKIKKDLGDLRGVASTLSNIGIVHADRDELDKALGYFEESIQLKKELDDRRGLAYTYEELANIYRKQGKVQWALDNYELAIELIREFNEPSTMAAIQGNLAQLYIEIGRYDEGRELLKQSLSAAEAFGDLRLQQKLLLSLSELEEAENEPAKALGHYKTSIALRDSILNEEQAKSMIEMRTKYETEKMEREGKQQVEEEKLRRNVAMAGLGMAFILLTVVFYNNRQKNKANQLLTRQKSEIEEKNVEIRFQNKELEEQKREIQGQAEKLRATNSQLEEALLAINEQKEQIEEQAMQITDSIRYAKDIQFAILPSQARIKLAYPELFILNKPRDIVSGDFYWYASHSGKDYLAVADCTGHGVPGALMSMVCNDFFDYSINEREIANVDEALNQVHKAVRIALKQEEQLNADGMEVALCALDRENKTLEYAGAKRPIYYIQDGIMHEIRGDKKPIGGKQKEVERRFTRHIIDVSKPTTFYIFSDGYHDQFGGDNGKKFMSQRFKEYLFSIHTEPMERQKELLTMTLHDWMNPIGGKSHKQIDDILVVGGRV